MTADDRHRLGRRLLREQNSQRFGGRKKDAYIAARVSQATWESAINGRSMKDHTIRQIVVNLWPEAEGDWRRIPELDPPGGESTTGGGYSAGYEAGYAAGIEAARQHGSSDSA